MRPTVAVNDAFKVALSFLLSVCLIGCTTMRTVQSINPADIGTTIKPGDQVHVIVKDGRTFDFEVAAVEKDMLIGKANKMTYKVGFSEIRTLQRAEHSHAKTAGAITLGVLATWGSIVLAAGLIFAHMLSKSDN
jgi:hypothetical protein